MSGCVVPPQTVNGGALRSGQMRAGRKIAYASGALVDGVMFNSLNIFLFFYLSTATSIPVHTSTSILGFAVLADAVITPLIGIISDRLSGPLGRRLPIMIVALPLAIWSIHEAFTLPASEPSMLVPLLASAALTARISLAMYQVSHLALGADLPLKYAERSQLSAFRWFFNIIGGLVVVIAGLSWHMMEPERAAPEAFERFAILLVLTIALGGLSGCSAAWSLRDRSAQRVAATTAKPLARVLREAFQNPTFVLLLTGSGLFFTGFSISNLLNLHAKLGFWNLKPSHVQLVLIAYFVGLLAAAPLAIALAPRFEKKLIACCGLFGFVFAQAGPVVVKLLVVSALGPEATTYVLIAASLFAGMSLGVAGSTLNSMMGDAADEHELAHGTRLQGTFFSVTAFANKVANGVAILMTGWALDLFDFTPGDGISMTETKAIGVLFGPVAGAFSLAALIPLTRYHINRSRHAEVVKALHFRRNSP